MKRILDKVSNLYIRFEHRLKLEVKASLPIWRFFILIVICVIGFLFAYKYIDFTLFKVFPTLTNAMNLYSDNPNNHDSTNVRNIGLLFASLLGVPFIVWRAIIANQQMKTGKKTLLNDTLNSATQALTAEKEIKSNITLPHAPKSGNSFEPELITRLAAIERLRSLAHEDYSLAPKIVKLIASYIRINFPTTNTKPTTDIAHAKIPRLDLQAAIDAIGDILKIAQRIDNVNWRVNLRNCNFDGASFENGYFRAVDFSHCRFEQASVSRSNFVGCKLINALITFQKIKKANFTGADFSFANSNILKKQHQIDIFINYGSRSKFKGANFSDANISHFCFPSDTVFVLDIFGSRNTTLEKALELKRPNHNAIRELHFYKKSQSNSNTDTNKSKIKKKIADVEKSNFKHWSPFTNDDLATEFYYEDFLKSKKMHHWPYIDE